MRQTIIAALLVFTLTPAVLAQTIGDDEYTAYQNQQVEDYWSLFSLHEVIDVVLTENDSIANASEYDQGMLRLVAGDTLRTIDRMRDRARVMFTKVEQNYEQYCLRDIPGPLPCSVYQETYRVMIADTLMLGSTYYTASEDSRDVLSVLNE